MDIFAGIFELIGNYLIGNKNKFGFLINIVSCFIWIYVAIIFHIYGLLIVVVPAIIINIRNFFKWCI